MSEEAGALITHFYQAFQRLDAEAMVACYTEDVVFSDPTFGELRERDVGDMWRMLTTRAKDFSLTFDSISADGHSGSAHWVATYLFGKTGRVVTNDVQARFVFREGKICEHHDHFDLWRWSRQALGIRGLLLGWSSLVRKAVRTQALKGLRGFQANRESSSVTGSDQMPMNK
ncbi:Ketosteroid isomerase [Giardia muris]|uniref:Ketosteroid isomerase n=1 Tax=Giardia muris TaxID=5742 RepID=A0A4Z1SML1_GIAMU|nr:Ketosteroid isomerase [Giardia muris]TNJ28085.1 Ketosteroid isomerase [Giardia muris]|eukprot:TNJ26932.1 Ketosteroid isomerase [Giardia muris]